MNLLLKVVVLTAVLGCLLAMAYRQFRAIGGRAGHQDGQQLLSELAQLPQGLRVIHTPASVLGPHEGPNTNDWTYRWYFRTEVHPIGEDVRILAFGILAWNGSSWVLDTEQKLGNSGLLDQATFIDWYGLDTPTLTRATPAIDESNWAGSMRNAPFEQLWFFIGENTSGVRVKGEGIVSLGTTTRPRVNR